MGGWYVAIRERCGDEVDAVQAYGGDVERIRTGIGDHGDLAQVRSLLGGSKKPATGLADDRGMMAGGGRCRDKQAVVAALRF
ncbi:hypothetical protein [Rhodococcus tibetensis]|uniref:Uncharacterized protein n=1 Tax=Rhodococcus tibetensis TaxID=2965064 RepID=A0ABT1QNK4_9NOCA|nr:hypothetical protein [Rhodococcus sp. FXJ9.536]MCQ4122712.1 hypothetical protein [Rhodococcus sp. FXJ9.536]